MLESKMGILVTSLLLSFLYIRTRVLLGDSINLAHVTGDVLNVI